MDISFEIFPTEIKVLIMCYIQDLESLKQLVLASSNYHQAYLGAREEVLHHLTHRILQKHVIDITDPWVCTLWFGPSLQILSSC